MPACASCGHENVDGAKFCSECGAGLVAAEATPAREVRKTVTVVFCDVTGSTALGERLDPESLRSVMTRYFDRMKTVLESHGASVEKFIGDAVMAVFGIPMLHEDDALRAVRAAAGMREALAELNTDLERDWGVTIAVRIGVNTGQVVAGDPSAGQNLVTGDTVNTAARLEQAASPGEVLIGDETFRLTRDAVVVEPVDPLALKGKADAVDAFRLLEVRAGALGHERRMDSPMVGRERPLRMLRDSLEGTVADRACYLVTVLGSAGMGKSRLVREFLDDVADGATVLQGRCLSYGDGITFWPVAEIVTKAAGIVDGDDPPDGDRPHRKPPRGSRRRRYDREPPRRAPRAHGRGRGRCRLGAPAAVRASRGGAATHRRLRRHPLGRAHAARRHRAGRRLVPRCADPRRVHGAAGVPRGTAGLGRRQAARRVGAAGTPRRGGVRSAHRQSPRAAGAHAGHPRAHLRRRPGQPVVRRGDALDAAR